MIWRVKICVPEGYDLARENMREANIVADR